MISLSIFSCKQNETDQLVIASNEKVTSGQISISCDAHLQRILNILIIEFNITFPDIRMTMQEAGSDFYLNSDNLPCELFSDSAWKIPVMREGIIPVISDNNPHLDKLLEQGLNKELLKSVFTGSIHSWGELLGIDDEREIRVLLPAKGMGHNKKWEKLIGVDAGLLQGEQIPDKTTLLDLFRNE